MAVTAATEWAYTVSSTDGTQFSGGALATISPVQYAFFDAGGQFINTSGVSAPQVATDVHQADGQPFAAAGDQLTVASWGTGPGNNSMTNTPLVPGPIGLDISSMTSQATTFTATSTAQNGVAPGILRTWPSPKTAPSPVPLPTGR